MRKSIVLLFASLSFMASSAFANPAALRQAVSKITSNSSRVTQGRQTQLSNRVEAVAARVNTSAVALNVGLAAVANAIVEAVEADATDLSMQVDIAVEKMVILSEKMANMSEDAYKAVQPLFEGKILTSLKGKASDEEKLSEGNIDSFITFVDNYVAEAVTKGINPEVARETAAGMLQAGLTYEQFKKACEEAAEAAPQR